MVYRRGTCYPCKNAFSPSSYLLLPLSPAHLSESWAGDSRSGYSNQQPLVKSFSLGNLPDLISKGKVQPQEGKEKQKGVSPYWLREASAI